MAFCPSCGQADPGYPACRRCGAVQPTAAPLPPPPVYVVQRSSDGVTILAIVLIIIFVIIPLVLVLVFLGLLGAACSAATGAFVPAVWLASRRSRICRQALAQALARP